MRNQKKSEAGLALLESAALLSILVLFFIGAVALVQYCRALWLVDSIVDRYVFDQAAKPYSIRTGNEGVSIELNQSGVESAITQINQSISSEISQLLEAWSLSDSATFFSETAYAELRVDTNTGATDGLANPSESETYGSQEVKSKLDSQVTLEEQFDEASKQQFKTGRHTSALYAVKGAPVLGESGGGSYLPSTVLIATRVGVSFEETWIGEICSFIGINPFIVKSKVVGLRGEIGA